MSSEGLSRLFRGSLYVKIIASLLLVLITALSVTTFLELQDKSGFFRAKLEGEIDNLNTVLNAALYNVMMNENVEGLQVILSRVAEVEGIRQAYVLNADAEIYMASDAEMAGELEIANEVAHVRDTLGSYESMKKSASGEDYMLGLTPIVIEAACLDCHDDMNEGDIIGLLGLEKSAKADVESMQGSLWRSVLSAAAAVVLIGLVIAWLISRLVTKPLKLTIDNLSHGSDSIISASSELTQSSAKLAEGANDQASSLEEVSSSLEELASVTQQNADNTREASSLAVKARESAESGNASMSRMSEAIAAIKESSDKTANVIKTIDEIAFQTNLLALNAAVEAARAGESGKGFAVVAEEVRALAQRSAGAAKNTADLLETSRAKAVHGVAAIEEVASEFERIYARVQKVTELINGIAEASREQADGIQQISTAVSEMDGVTQQNAAASEQFTATSQGLLNQADALNQAVIVLKAILGGTDTSGVALPGRREPAGLIDNR